MNYIWWCQSIQTLFMRRSQVAPFHLIATQGNLWKVSDLSEIFTGLSVAVQVGLLLHSSSVSMSDSSSHLHSTLVLHLTCPFFASYLTCPFLSIQFILLELTIRTKLGHLFAALMLLILLCPFPFIPLISLSCEGKIQNSCEVF